MYECGEVKIEQQNTKKNTEQKKILIKMLNCILIAFNSYAFKKKY